MSGRLKISMVKPRRNEFMELDGRIKRMMRMKRGGTTPNKTPTTLREIYAKTQGSKPVARRYTPQKTPVISKAGIEQRMRNRQPAVNNFFRRAKAAENKANIEQRMRNRQPAVNAFFKRAKDAENKKNIRAVYTNLKGQINRATNRSSVMKVYKKGVLSLHPNRGGTNELFVKFTSNKNTRLKQF